MLKKPLFWIIVVIVIVILWFVFAGRGKQELSNIGGHSSQQASAPVSSPSSANQGSAGQ